MGAAAALLFVSALAAGDGPIVYEVPPGGASLADQRRAPFIAAPFRVEAGQVLRGDWRSSDEILGRGSTRVVVVASWCPACKELLSRMAREPGRAWPIVLFLEDEHALRTGRDAPGSAAGPGSHGDPVLLDATVLEGFPLQLWLLRSGSNLARQVTRYPTHLVCTRDGCRPAAAARPTRT
jgi:thiol-disulfide isomerase/thioredoxin